MPLLENSITQLKEFHGAFKSICDTFAIDSQEFQQIFNLEKDKNEAIFKIWDKDPNGLIDALELFSGLIVLAEAQFQDQMRFLFDIFDFNELNSLSIVDLEFMFISIGNALYKLHSVEAEMTDDDVVGFFSSDFHDDQRINISQMLQWCAKNQIIIDLMIFLKKSLPEDNQKDADIYNNITSKKDELYNSNQTLVEVISGKKYSQKIDWISNLCKKIHFNQSTNPPITAQKDIKVGIKWVYGFRSHDVRHPLSYLLTDPNNERIVYFTSSIIILYNMKMQQQQHYIEHDQEVISLTVSRDNKMIASGELAHHPAIHIWDPITLQTNGIIKGIHHKGITQLAFFKGDTLLATCGLRENTPILIYNVRSLQLVLSTSVIDPIVDLMTLENYVGSFESQLDLSYDSSFYVTTKRRVYQYTFTEDLHLDVSKINMRRDFDIDDPITCATAYRINTQNPYMKSYFDNVQAEGTVITGHESGAVYCWVNLQNQWNLDIFSSEITRITNYQYGIIICTGNSQIYLKDFTFQNNIQKIELSKMSFKLFDYQISDIMVGKNQFFITTRDGDIVRIQGNQIIDWNANQFNEQVNADRINYVTQLKGNMKAMCILEKTDSVDHDDRILFVAGTDSKVYGFSLDTHEIIDMWTIGSEQQITALDCVSFEDGGTVFAVGCKSGKIFLRIDWEESPRSFDCPQMIHDLKFSSDTFHLVAACDDGHIFIFHYNNNSYFQVHPQKMQLNEEIPISIFFVDDNKSFLVSTSSRSQYKIDLPDKQSKNIFNENQKIFITQWYFRYPMVIKDYMNSMLPIVVGGDIQCFVAAGESGFIFYWRDSDQLDTNCGGYYQCHTSLISRILMTKAQDSFFSLGEKDNTLIEWSVDFINDHCNFTQQFKKEPELLMINIQQKLIPLKDEVLIRELAFAHSAQSNIVSDNLRDTFLKFRSTKEPMLNLQLNEILGPLDQSQLLLKRSPPLSIQLEFVYGFAAFDQRRTLAYVHYYWEDIQETRERNQQRRLRKGVQDSLQIALEKEVPVQSIMGEKIISSKNQMGDEYCHDQCRRSLVYFISRIAIVYNPEKNKQQFYEGHQAKITCISVHPQKFIVATGQADQKPTIHIWNAYNCNCIKIIPTFHKTGIMLVTFSYSSTLLASVGNDINFSIQITNWVTEEIIAFRNSGHHHVFDISFNPYNSNEFITGGTHHISIWSIQSQNLSREYLINTSLYIPNSIITCLSYINFRVTESQREIDIIGGTNTGDIVLVTNGQLYILRTSAHKKMINCLKVCRIFEKTVILTCGEDEMIKMWDNKFKNPINEINLRASSINNEFYNKKGQRENVNLSAQSLDVFFCFFEEKENNKQGLPTYQPKWKKLPKAMKRAEPRILIGTRMGDIIEAFFKPKTTSSNSMNLKLNQKQEGGKSSSSTMQVFQQNLDDEDDDQEAEEEIIEFEKKYESLTQQYFWDSEQYSINLRLLQKSHSSQNYSRDTKASAYDNINNKQVYFALHPKEPIMVTIGEDNYIFVIDVEDNNILMKRPISKNTPSAIKFNTDGDLLVVGFVNGETMIFDSKMKKNQFGSASEKFELSSLETLMILQQKESKTPVLNIEFSPNGDFLAISFDSARDTNELQSKLEKEGSFITIYSNKTNQIKRSARNENLYLKYCNIRCPSIYDKHQTDSNSYGSAVHYMTFSKDANNQYLLIYYQLIDQYLIRLNQDTEGQYIVWDLVSNSGVKNHDFMKAIVWSKLDFPNSLISQYQEYPLLLLKNQRDLKKQNVYGNVPTNPFLSVMFDMTNMLQRDSLERNQNQMGGGKGDDEDIEIPYLICGSIKGDIHFVKTACLKSDKQSMMENISNEKFLLAKSYSAHVSFVNQCETTPGNAKYLFTSGITDECIMQWQFKLQKQLWDIDFLEYKPDMSDIYAEILPQDRFSAMLNDVLPVRAEVSDVVQQVGDKFSNSTYIELELENIIGRLASNRHQNLFYDYDERILYIAGCNLVILYPPHLQHLAEQKGRLEDKKLNEIEQQIEEEEYDDDQQQRVKQEFIKVDPGQNSSAPMISCISVSTDQKLVCVGTIQINAQLLIWNVSSKICIHSLTFTNCSYITVVQFAHDDKHIACVGINNDYTLVVFLIDTNLGEILGCTNFTYSLPFKFKDLLFYPNAIHRFVTCGIQNMTKWNYNGGILSFNALQIEPPRELQELKKLHSKRNINDDQQDGDIQGDNLIQREDEAKQEEEQYSNKSELKISFLVMVFVKDVLISGGDDGYIYIWNNEKIIQRHLAHQAHPKPMIVCMDTEKNTDVFCTGAIDGKVILWRLSRFNQEYFDIIKVKEYVLNQQSIPEGIRGTTDFHFQSLCMGKKTILAGTQSGDIYQLTRPTVTDSIQQKDEEKTPADINENVDITKSQKVLEQDSEINKEQQKDKQQQQDQNEFNQTKSLGNEEIKKTLSCHDADVPKSLAFSYDSELLYTITARGIFSVWNVQKLKKVYTQNFMKEVVGILISKEKGKIIIAFEQQIINLSSEDYTFLWDMEITSSITDIKLSKDEKILAIALLEVKNKIEETSIQLFEVDDDQYKFLCKVEKLSTSIDFIDFTEDNLFLMYRDNSDQVHIIEMANLQKTDSLFIEHNVEWCSDGIRISEKTRGVHPYYSERNQIRQITQITQNNDEFVAVTDEMGTIRLFNYPSQTGHNGAYFQCYVDHLNYINQCVVSPNQMYLATSSQVDRCILIWKVHTVSPAQEKDEQYDKQSGIIQQSKQFREITK